VISPPETHHGVATLPAAGLEDHLDRRRLGTFSLPRPDPGAFLSEILNQARAFVPSEAGSVLMDRPGERGLAPEASRLVFVAAFGPAAEQLVGQTLEARNGVAGDVYCKGRPYLLADPGADPTFYAQFDADSSFTTTGVIAVPIRIEHTVCGVLELVNREHGQFTERDLGLLEIFGNTTSSFIENLLDARRAAEMARRDDLTGLANDRFFHHRLTEDLIRADLMEQSLALLFLDLDNFKEVNDTLGHLAGSQVLKEFGLLLEQTVDHPRATVARYGGDEFVIILPDADVDLARAVAEDITDRLRRCEFLRGNFDWAEGPVRLHRHLSASVGVAAYPRHLSREGSTDLRKNLLMRAADQAMYAAKAEGKDRVIVAE
jgi:diguanylate cyclase (GGDEF)-like protein